MILLINAPGIYANAFNLLRDPHHLPYACAVLAAHLRQAGFAVCLTDLRHALPAREQVRLGWRDVDAYLQAGRSTRPMRRYLALLRRELAEAGEARLVGISVLSHLGYPHALVIARALKEWFPRLVVCVGGAFVTIRDLPRPPFVDHLVRGSGAAFLIRLAAQLHRGQAGGALPPPRGRAPAAAPQHSDLEAEAAPDFSGLALEAYRMRDPLSEMERVLILPYRTSAGCAHRCSFCTGRLTQPLRFKSPEKVVREVKALVTSHPRSLIRFCDASLNSPPARFTRVFEALLAEVGPFLWEGYVNVRSLSPELLRLFARSGCRRLLWGVESGSQRMVRLYGKDFDVSRAPELLRLAADLGIRNVVTLILGGPTETDEDLRATERFARSLMHSPNIMVIANRFLLEEGAEIHRHPERYGIVLLPGRRDAKITTRPRIPWRDARLSPGRFALSQGRVALRLQRLRLACRLAVARKKIRQRRPGPGAPGQAPRRGAGAGGRPPGPQQARGGRARRRPR